MKSSRDREWLEADGTGSFSSLTETWDNRRKYHSLLSISGGAGFSRIVLLQNLLFNWRPLAPTMVQRDLQISFRKGPMRVSMVMPRGSRTIIMRFSLDRETELVPVINCRSIYDVLVKPSGITVGDEWIEISGSRLFISSTAGVELRRERAPPLEMYFDIDAARRESCRDEAHTPASFVLPPGEWYVSFGPVKVVDPAKMYQIELERRRAAVDRYGYGALSTEVYLLEDGGVIAGYHWFSQWGRDAMISLPGLTFPFGRNTVALAVLRYFASLVRAGRFPNAMDERTGQWSYNTVDAGLWFVNRLHLYWKMTGDDGTAEALLPVAGAIIRRTFHSKETVLVDGVLRHPPQWTWMDATGTHGPYVPRDAAVEIQALAYAALGALDEMYGTLKGEAPGWIEENAAELRRGFRNHFIDRNGFVLDTPGSSELRPNAFYVMYFPHTLMSPEEFSLTFRKLDEALTTDFGSRTIDPHSGDYRGTYLPEKDPAYHNGTVWPFIAGAAARAYVRTFGDTATTRHNACERYLSGILEGLYSGGRCPGHIAEILDGDSPHIERGCIAQAWSMAEPLWAYWELMEKDE